MVFALIGNQNCGKTTLFNQLTGSNQHTGNFPGVTVEKKEGLFKKHKKMTVVDLPGIYSLSPYTQEELVTRDFLIREKPDAIINILDATNIERNLYLTLQIMELNIPMVLALNFMDELRSSGNHIKITKLEELLGVDIVPISASKNEGIEELIELSIETAKNKRRPKKLDYCTGQIHKAIHSIAHIVDDKAKEKEIPTRFCATKLVEGDQIIIKELGLTESEIDIIGHIVDDMEKNLQNDKDAILADMRYDYIEKICSVSVFKRGETKEYLRSVQIDNLLTHKYFAIPIFLLIMLVMFWLTFSVIGGTISDLFSNAIDSFIGATGQLLSTIDLSPTIVSFIVDGVLTGVGSVLSFMPIILILFFFLSMLEDSGYMARVAFVMDKLLRKIGLSGRSFVPMLIGFGCSVPAIMATRTLPSHRDRKMTIMLVPFMSCSAKLPIYALFTAVFFKENQAIVMTGLYVLGILVGILAGLLLKNTIFKGEPVPFVMELPAYRLPSFKSVFLNMWDKAKDFIVKAFTIIFFATIIIWVMQSFDFSFDLVSDSSNSILAYLGKIIAPIFVPLGFSDWRVATALVTGLTAKEAVVSTMAVLMNMSGSNEILSSYFTTASAISFLIFTLLYMPCVATLAAIKREMGGMYNAILVMAFQTVVAWIVAFVIYNVIILF